LAEKIKEGSETATGQLASWPEKIKEGSEMATGQLASRPEKIKERKVCVDA
jgi:hypothetical protein